MAFPAVIELKRLGSNKKTYVRRKYTLKEAEKMVQTVFGENKVEIKNLYELKLKCLSHPRARKELTDAIYHILIDQGIDVEGNNDIRDIAESLFAEIFGYSIFQPYIDESAYNEVYFNGPKDCWAIKGLEREPLDIEFRDEDHALTMLQRLTENSRDGKAAHDNRINSTVLPGRTRLRWSLPPVADQVSANIRKHSEEDMKSISFDKFLQDHVMNRKVFSLLVGMGIMGACYGILGPGGVGKTALLRVILREVHEKMRPRFLISENGAELLLREYLQIVGIKDADVHSQQKWSGKNETLTNIFANFMQAKGEFIIQPEVLMPEEVDNILMASRRGHVMGPFTFHSYPHKFIDALVDLYLQRYTSDRESVVRTICQDVLASCHYDIIYSEQGKKRKIMGVYEHVNGQSKPIYQYDPYEDEYKEYGIENIELKQKLGNLKYISPSYYEEVKHLL